MTAIILGTETVDIIVITIPGQLYSDREYLRHAWSLVSVVWKVEWPNHLCAKLSGSSGSGLSFGCSWARHFTLMLTLSTQVYQYM